MEKTLITHAVKGQARFLGYEINVSGIKAKPKVRAKPMLRVPKDVTRQWMQKVMANNKPTHRNNLIHHSDYDIVATYGLELAGLVNYYQMAINVAQQLYQVKYVYLVSAIKTLARKHKVKATRIARKHYSREGGLRHIKVEVTRDNKPPLVARVGHRPIKRVAEPDYINDDIPLFITRSRTQLLDRMLAESCELCGSADVPVEVHHIQKLKNLKKRYQGRKDPPRWMIRMIELSRKTLVVCLNCHQKIHQGVYDGPRLK